MRRSNKPLCRRTACRGSVYVFVLAVSMLVMVIGVGALAAMRIENRTTRLGQDWNAAGVLAQSAVEQAVLTLSSDFQWRNTYMNYKDGNYTPEIPMGRGAISWYLRDIIDNKIEDDPADPLRVYGRARVGQSVRIYSVLAYPTGQTLDVLRTAIHASGEVDVKGILDVRVGPASSNSTLIVSSSPLIGSVEASTVTNPENVIGSVVTPAPVKTMPARVLFSTYKSFANEIKYNDVVNMLGGKLQYVLISPAHHPTQSNQINADGIYWIKVPAFTTLQILDCRIQGTLLVELSGDSSKLEIGPSVVWQPERRDYPALIVYTNHDVSNDVLILNDGVLNESNNGINFNPDDTPYYGNSDDDLGDKYNASIRGLIHVIRDKDTFDLLGNLILPSSLTTIDAPRRISGCIVVEGDVRIEDGSILEADPWLYSTPPLGYTTSVNPNNLLTNGGMESGLTGWAAVGSGTTLNWDGNEHTGNKSIKVKDRNSASSGIRQDVTSQIVSDTAYNIDLWLRMDSNPEDANIALELDSSGEGTQWITVVAPSITKNWTRFATTITPSWTGTLNYARLVVTTTTTNQEFFIDDVWLTNAVEQAQLPPTVMVMPGTWRPEAAQ